MKLASKILVAYDGSELSEKALKKAIEIAKTDSEVQLTVVNVLDLTRTIANSMMFDEILKEMRSAARELLQKAEEIMDNLPNPTTTFALEGSPGREISQFVKENRYDLVVMGSRGLSDFKELFLGSVSHYVTQHVYCPILIIK